MASVLQHVLTFVSFEPNAHFQFWRLMPHTSSVFNGAFGHGVVCCRKAYLTKTRLVAAGTKEGLHKARFASSAMQVTGDRCPWGSSSPVFAPEPASRRPSWPWCVLAGAHSGMRRPTPPAGCAVPSRGSRAQTASPGATRSSPGPGIAPSCGRTAA